MEKLLPYRHKSKISKKLNLTRFPNDIKWNGSIIYLDRDGVINKGSEILIEEFPSSEDFIDTKDKIEKI